MPLEVRVGDEPGYYATVAAGVSNQTLTGHPDATQTGIIGDYIHEILAIPASTSPGAISITDGSTSITLFTGGASSVGDLKPFSLPVRMRAKGAGWKITTGANIAAIVKGVFGYK